MLRRPIFRAIVEDRPKGPPDQAAFALGQSSFCRCRRGQDRVAGAAAKAA